MTRRIEEFITCDYCDFELKAHKVFEIEHEGQKLDFCDPKYYPSEKCYEKWMVENDK